MKTTKSHFKAFEKEVKRLIKQFGLIAWEAHIEHEKTSASELATTSVDFENRQFVITLGMDWGDQISPQKIKEVALHEILEVVFWKIESMVARHLKEEAREEVHGLIQTFINVSKGI